MKKSVFSKSLLFLFVAIVALFSSRATYAVGAETLRIMSYNIRNGRGMDNKVDYPRIAEVIQKNAPDVVALQELDCRTSRSQGVDVLSEIATILGMYPTYGAAIDFQGGKYGVGILSKEKPIRVETTPLPGREERRALLCVELENYVVFCSHWSLTEEDRNSTVAIITNKTKQYTKPVFLCGDFNAHSEEDSILSLKMDWAILSADAPTFPANSPDERIDYICATDPNDAISEETWQKSVLASSVVNAPNESDHRPILVEVDMKLLETEK